MRTTILTLLLLLAVNYGFAQLATYTGTGGTSTAVIGVANETVTILQNTGFGSNTPCGSGGLSGKTVSTAFTTYSTSGPKYFIQIRPNAGYKLNVTGFSAGMRISGTGPTKVRYAYSLDNGATWIDDGTDHPLSNPGCGNSVASSWSAGALPVNITNTTNGIIVALFPFASSNSTGTFQTNYINILGNVQVACTTPTPILGPANVCVGSVIVLSDATVGGTWSSSNGNAVIGSTTGIVTGAIIGSSVITYSTGAGCFSTATIAVNPLPGAITGAGNICIGSTTALSDGTIGGTWITSSSNVSVGSASGIVTGISAGAATISYLLGTGCFSVFSMTVDPLPVGISGATNVCVGSSVVLSDATPGGSWSSSNSNASIGSLTGVVTGNTAGTSIITYTLSTGCITTKTMNIDPVPGAIIGSARVCVGSVIVLSNVSPGGSWSSSNTNATIGSLTGILTGISTGSSVITYLLATGCLATSVITIDPLPGPVSGPSHVCVGSGITLSDATPGGVWSCSNANVTIGSLSGFVFGINPGSSVVTYALATGCISTYGITVDPIPSGIIGLSSVCIGATISLSDAITGGTWSSSNTNVSVGSLTGIVTGLLAGTSVISYKLGTGCHTTALISIVPLPLAITGATSVCVGSNTVLSNTTLGGTWSASNSNVTVGVSSGVVTGISPGFSILTYTSPAGCFVSMTLTVVSTPSVISGPSNVCVGSSIAFSDATPGGVWSASNSNVIIGSVSGILSGVNTGTSIISYALSSGCFATTTITIDALPSLISGSSNVCVGSSVILSDATPSGSWSGGGINATITPATGVVSGISAGMAVFSYTLPTGCSITTTVIVDPLPTSISGPSGVCVGSGIILSDASAGGNWSSSNSNTIIGSVTGIAVGVNTGISIITYILPTGCYTTASLVVHPLPLPISGTFSVCVGFSTTLSDPTPGGTWSSSNGNILIGSANGIVTGVTTGLSTVTYTVGTGCIRTIPISVISHLPPITGNTNICAGSATILSDIIAGGTWTSSNPTVAIIGLSSALVSGLAAGTTVITYSLGTGCTSLTTLTINPMPAAISGASVVCPGTTILLSDSVTGGTWSSSNPGIATIGSSSGIVYGVVTGTATIDYSLRGCKVTGLITVLPLPVAYSLTGGGSFCSSGTGVHIGLNGSSVGVNYFLYNGSTPVGAFIGTGSNIDFGLQSVAGTYIVSAVNTVTGCSRTMGGTATVVVLPSPVPSVSISLPAGDTVCEGATVTMNALPSNGGSAPAYLWNINGTNVGSSTSYSFIPANGDIIKVTMTSNASCALPAITKDSLTIVVNPHSLPSVMVAANPGDTICSGNSVTVSTTPLYGGTSPVYEWLVNGVAGGSGPSYTFVPVDGDVVYCKMTSNHPCRTKNIVSSNREVISVVDQIIPVVTIHASTVSNILPGQPDTLTASVANGTAVAYQWYINGVPISGATNGSFIHNTFNEFKPDSVTCIVTTGGNCPITSFGWIYISVGKVGVISQTEATQITVFPNPSLGIFTINGYINNSSGDKIAVVISDLIGNTVYYDQFEFYGNVINKKIELDRNLSNGLYLLSIRSAHLNKVFHLTIGK